jgi:TolA-binding protein
MTSNFRYVFFQAAFSLCLASCASLWSIGGEQNHETSAAGSSDSQNAVVPATDRNVAKADAPKNTQSGSDASAKISGPADASQRTTNDELELRYTRILSRLDSMDAEIMRQREKLRLLEQGLLTGIAPDDIKKGSGNSSSSLSDRSSKKSSPGRESLSTSAAKAAAAPLAKPKLDDLSLPRPAVSDENSAASALMTKIQLAKEHYQAGRFGLAISELAAVSREYSDKVHEGVVKLWLGKSYLGLKEYQTARGELEAYLREYPSGEFVAEARLGLARSLLGLGLRERARAELRQVVKDFDGNEYAEMASAELKNIQGSL